MPFFLAAIASLLSRDIGVDSCHTRTHTGAYTDKLYVSVARDASEPSVHIGCVDAVDRVAAVTVGLGVCVCVCVENPARQNSSPREQHQLDDASGQPLT